MDQPRFDSGAVAIPEFDSLAGIEVTTMQDEQEETADCAGVTVADHGMIDLRSELLFAEHKSESVGVKTLQWPGRVCVVSGVDTEDGNVTVGQVMDPEDAREIAETLQKAADSAEENEYVDDSEKPDDEESLLRRLISKVQQ